MSRGDIDQSSFGFTVDTDKWEERDNILVRTISKVRQLFDVSPVTYPAYPDATVALRSLNESEKETRRYTSENGEPIDWYDITLNAATKYATNSIQNMIYRLDDSLSYLRAEPEGSMSQFAKTHIDMLGDKISELAKWLAENGADSRSIDRIEVTSRSLEEFRKEETPAPTPEEPTENHSIALKQRALDLIDKTAI